MTKQNLKYIFITGGTITVLAATGQLFEIKIAPYFFSIGAAILIYLHFNRAMENKNSDFRQKRLSNMSFMSSLLLGIAAYFMFTNSNLWVVTVLIYALVSLFHSFRSE